MSLKTYLDAYRQIAIEDIRERMEKNKWRRHIPFVEFIKVKGEVLEIGCGMGSLSVALNQQRKKEVVGLDLSCDYLKVAKKKGLMDVVCGVAEYLPFRENIFDTIICDCILEHVLDIRKVVKSVSSILKPHGHFYIEVPYDEDISRYDEQHGVKQHVRSFDDANISCFFGEIDRKRGIVASGLDQHTFPAPLFIRRSKTILALYLKVCKVTSRFLSLCGREFAVLTLDKVFLGSKMSRPVFILIESRKET